MTETVEVQPIDENFILAEADRLRSTDPSAAKCYIITARSLFPDKFSVHLIAYNLEKEEQNPQQAAICFSYICSTFPQMETWKEFIEMMHTLQIPEAELTAENEFYLKMFPFITNEVQQKLILTGLQKTENILSKSKLLLMTFQRFPQVARAHSSHLLELLTDGAIQNQHRCQELLVEEALPLYFENPPELQPSLVCRIYTLSLEFFIHKILKEDLKREISDNWRKLFKILMFCSKILRWETFPPYRKNLTHRQLFDKILELMASNKTDPTIILFHGTTLFLYSLYCYIKSSTIRLDDVDIEHVLVEGFTDWVGEKPENFSIVPPKISYPSTSNEMITEAFVYAAKCWQILNNEPYLIDFNKLLISMPLKVWIAHFLYDLSTYYGHQEEATKLMCDMLNKNSLISNVQELSLTILRGDFILESFGYILKILTELPAIQGKEIDCLSITEPRHMVYLPLTQKALVQYCAKALIEVLKHKLLLPTCSNQLMGDVLILSQIEYPYDTTVPEQIFSNIMTRRSFVYHKLFTYLVVPDFLEEFFYIAHSQNENFTLDISVMQPISNSNTVIHSPEETALPQCYHAEPESPPIEEQGIPVIKRPSSTSRELLQQDLQQQTGLDIFPSQKEQSIKPMLLEQTQDSSQPLGPMEECKISTQQESSRRTSRCSEKSESSNYRSIFKQQIGRANENLANIIANFIIQEQASLIQNLFGTPPNNMEITN